MNSNWANRTKQTLSTVETSNLKPVGGGSLEPIVRFYQYKPPTESAGPLSAQFNKNESVEGVYEGSFVTKKFQTTFYKVRTAEGLVAIPSTGQLSMLMSKVAENATVKITYMGKEKITKGQRAGKEAHKFSVAASDLKAE